MRYTHAEKLEMIHRVETSDQPVKRTLAELGVPRSTFDRWYERYRVVGAAGLADQSPGRAGSGTAFRCGARAGG